MDSYCILLTHPPCPCSLPLAMGSAASGLAAVMIFMVRKLRQQIKHKRIQPLMWKMSLDNARRGNKSVRNMRAATTTSVERSQVKKTTSVDSGSNGATIHEKYCFELLLPREFALTETVQGVKEAIEQCRSVPSEEQTLFLIESPGRYHQADLCEGNVAMRKVEDDANLSDLVDEALVKTNRRLRAGHKKDISITFYLKHEGDQHGTMHAHNSATRQAGPSMVTSCADDGEFMRGRSRQTMAHVLIVGAAGLITDMQEINYLYSQQSCDLAANKFAAKLGDIRAWKALSCLRGVEGGAQPRSFLSLLYSAMLRCDTLKEFTVDIHDQNRTLLVTGLP